MDIHGYPHKIVLDIDMDMDVIIHLHGKPGHHMITNWNQVNKVLK